MKCNECGKEAVFYYSTNINGDFNETRLCLDCAREEGFGEMLEFKPVRMFERMLTSPFGGFFDDFFSFGPSMLPSAVGLMAKPRECAQCGAAEGKIPQNAGEEVSRRRELAALKNQLESAVKSENFERAIELRDKIKEFQARPDTNQ